MSAAVAYSKRRMNDALGAADAAEDVEIAFFCECADDRCYLPVFLTARAYGRARSDPEWAPLWRDHAAATPDAGDGGDGGDLFDSLCGELRGVPLS